MSNGCPSTVPIRFSTTPGTEIWFSLISEPPIQATVKESSS